ncbi:single-stranded DNA-binding protein [Mycoplasmopsis agalactiae]|uniref:single-stranded DNA-binding protein n=1 Tax=Mycoplasmopsis agalactiae TaxID=2110 RepID=UPI001F4923DC|nr:single-stranded DNA-binding protein [Mycoplasmopsis agalactiae]MCE6061644.1 single-stranded DNA-binding protein [Mycoplasmopsis agalactiae]
MSMRREDNNTIVLSGNVVNDEYYVKEFKSNKDTYGKLLKLKLHNTSGNKHNYFDIALWNANAQFILEKVKKDDLIEIIGHLESGSYSKDNEKVYFLSIVADRVKIIKTAFEAELEEKRAIVAQAYSNASRYSEVDMPTAESIIED